jgi:hypothetical protein
VIVQKPFALTRMLTVVANLLHTVVPPKHSVLTCF